MPDPTPEHSDIWYEQRSHEELVGYTHHLHRTLTERNARINQLEKKLAAVCEVRDKIAEAVNGDSVLGVYLAIRLQDLDKALEEPDA
jgi:hypothetical protein